MGLSRVSHPSSQGSPGPWVTPPGKAAPPSSVFADYPPCARGWGQGLWLSGWGFPHLSVPLVQ